MEESKNLEVRISDLWTVLKRCWIIMLAVSILLGAGIYIFKKQTHVPEYSSTATFYVKRENMTNMSYNEIYMANMLIKDFNELITNDQLYAKLHAETGIATPNELKHMITTKNPEDTRFTYVTFTAKSPEDAQLLVNTFADIICEDFNALYEVRKSDGTVQSRQLVGVYAYGTLNKSISNPISLLIISLIALVCAIIVFIIFLILFLADDKINEGEDVEKYLHLNVLGEIPNRNHIKRMVKYGYYAATDPMASDNKKS